MKANRWFFSSSSGQGCMLCLTSFGLVVEQVLLRRRARHVQVDDALGLRREVRRPGRQRVVGGGGRGRRARPAAAAVAAQERRQGDGAQAGLRVA